MSLFVKLVDGKITTVFLCSQDPDYYPDLLEIQENDPRYLAYIDDKESQERQWRNAELIRADEELNKVQDADPKAVGTVGQWREYRKNLRAYPESEGFSSGVRPVSPK